MKILVTGANGFVGKHLCQTLIKQGHEVVKHTRPTHGNITQISKFPELFKDVEIVYHLASTVHDYHVLDNFNYIDIETNCIGTQTLLDMVKIYCPLAKVVYTSTFYVNNLACSLPNSRLNQREEPTGLYGATNLCTEHICKIYSRVHNINVSIARLSNVFGTGEQTGNPKKAAFNKMVHEICNGQDIKIYTPSPYRDYIYITDVISALLIVAEKGTNREIYDVCTGTSSTVQSLLEFAILQAQSNSKTTPINPTKFHEQVGIFDWYCKPHDLLKLGWRPQVTVLDGIRKLVEAYKNE